MRRNLLKSCHEVLPHSPHACPLAIDVHGDAGQEASNLNTSNYQEDRLWSIRIKPADEEKGEDETVEDV